MDYPAKIFPNKPLASQCVVGLSFLFQRENRRGNGLRAEGGGRGLRAAGGGWRVAGGGWRVAVSL